MKNEPKLTIGLPVYNGENYLSEALDSILSQTFKDFKLIISDNASTDKTGQICSEYAKKDSRIKYFKNNKNYGAAYNHNKVFELSSSKYFKWMSSDDIHSPFFLEKCLTVMEKNPELVLTYPLSANIDNNGALINENTYNLDAGSGKPYKRFGSLILVDHNCNSIFGIIRSDALQKTKLLGNFISADRALLAELGLLGKFHEIKERLFFWRRHEKSSTIEYSRYNRSEWWDTSKKNRIVFPHWRLLKEFIALVYRSPVKWNNKPACYFQIIKFAVKRKKRLKKDIKQFTHSFLNSKWELYKK